MPSTVTLPASSRPGSAAGPDGDSGDEHAARTSTPASSAACLTTRAPVAGAIGPDRHAVAATLVLGVEPDRVGDSAAVDVERRTVDVIEGIGLLVVVRVERLVGFTSPNASLRNGLVVLGAREQPARRNAGLGEGVVVGPPVEAGVLGLLACGLEVRHQRPLDTRRTLGHAWSAVVGRRRGLVAVVGEVARGLAKPSMSKFRYRPMSLSASTSRVLMYSSEPTRPSSSAPQKANLTAFLTGGELPSWTAVSRMAAAPEPLSLMPGPSGTLSR